MAPASFTPEELFAHSRPCGVSRVVLIQMSFYQFDNRYMLDMMSLHKGVFSGTAVIDAHAKEPAHAFALSRMTQEVIGATPMGVFRAVERPVYDELMAEQISVAKGKGEGELAALLGSGDTWSIS